MRRSARDLLRRRLRQMRRDQHLEAQQDRQRYRDRQEKPFLVHQCPIFRSTSAPGHGIDATFMPRIAAQDALRRQRRAAHRAMHAQRLHRVFAAAWPEPAMRADERPHRPLIDAHRADAQAAPPGVIAPRSLSSARLISSCRAMKFRLRVLSRPISTRSAPATGRSLQHQPRRFLQPPARAVAHHGVADLLGHGEAQPHRSPSPRARACSTTPPTAAFLPAAAARRNSARRFRRPRLARGPGRLPTAGVRLEAGMIGTPACSRLRRTGACGPWRGGWPAPCGRQRSPCGREIRACACGPASTVDRCASRQLSETN